MITKTLFRITGPLCLTTVIALMGVPAASQAAGEQDAVPQKVVGYAGLDLNSEKGARAFYSRLRAAALSVCNASESVMPGSHTSQNPCVKKALGDAVQAVNRSQLTQLYLATYRAMPASSKLSAAIANARAN